MNTAVSDHLNLAGRTPLMPGRRTVREAVAEIVGRGSTIRQERLSGIHNPWGHCIGLTDPWVFLELCESDLVVEAGRAILGEDIILWDSELFCRAAGYAAFLEQGREGRYWPVEPLAGALVLLPVSREPMEATAVRLAEIGPSSLDPFDADEPLHVIRLMPATSHFVRDPAYPPNRRCMEEQVLINYSNRPLWLISGSDRAGNDLVTGFAPTVPLWASGAPLPGNEEK
jgi:hypothetical protein